MTSWLPYPLVVLIRLTCGFNTFALLHIREVFGTLHGGLVSSIIQKISFKQVKNYCLQLKREGRSANMGWLQYP